MDKCHILLRRPWKHDDGTYRGNENIYAFTWKGKRVVMRPIPPTTRFTKKNVPSPVFGAIKVIGTRWRVLLKRERLIQEIKEKGKTNSGQKKLDLR